MPNKKDAEKAALAEKEAADLKLKEQAEKEATELAEKEAGEKLATELAEKEKAEQLAKDKEGKTELSREEYLRIADEFGADVALETVKAGGDYNSALLSAYNAEKSGNVELRSQIEKLSANSTGKPAPVAVEVKKKSLFKLS